MAPPTDSEDSDSEASSEPDNLTGPSPAGTVPPTLPPSVEEAYRRKCIQLKQRLNEVEEANDAARLRLSRARRGIEKQRLERAFLLEQLAKRTSTNVEDSEGSPSPPPTPKEKPLRTKRGHRKPDFYTGTENGVSGNTFIQQGGPVTLSPSGSDAFSHTNPDSHPLASSQLLPAKRQLPSSNGHSLAAHHSITPPPAKPKSAFELYSNEHRPVIMSQNQEPERVLAQGWQNMGDAEKADYQRRYDELKKEGAVGSGAALSRDEDIEMGDGEDEGVDGGFTAVNRD